mmetsp:Transcript_2098/g.7498  ORF Transcript_2098/g.7498 Transcript_2098/m.7498 type:complete len:267 (+) Transcript_2098:954-1754(+)
MFLSLLLTSWMTNARTASVCPESTFILRNVVMSHTRTVQSYEPLNSLLCLVLTASESTGLVCSSNTCTHRLDGMSHTRTVLSADAVNTKLFVVSTAQTISSWPSKTVCSGALGLGSPPMAASPVMFGFRLAKLLIAVSIRSSSMVSYTFAPPPSPPPTFSNPAASSLPSAPATPFSPSPPSVDIRLLPPSLSSSSASSSCSKSSPNCNVPPICTVGFCETFLSNSSPSASTKNFVSFAHSNIAFLNAKFGVISVFLNRCPVDGHVL